MGFALNNKATGWQNNFTSDYEFYERDTGKEFHNLCISAKDLKVWTNLGLEFTLCTMNICLKTTMQSHSVKNF